MKTPHTSCWPGKRVLVKLKSGLKFVDRFLEKKGQVLVFQHHGRIHAGEIKAFSIVKGRLLTNSASCGPSSAP